MGSETHLRRQADALRAAITGEIPLRLHGKALDAAGNPDMAPEFLRYISRGSVYRGDGPRQKDHTPITIAFRTLRKESPLEYMVAERFILEGWDITAIAVWLDRSYRDAEVLVDLALGKLEAWASIAQA